MILVPQFSSHLVFYFRFSIFERVTILVIPLTMHPNFGAPTWLKLDAKLMAGLICFTLEIWGTKTKHLKNWGTKLCMTQIWGTEKAIIYPYIYVQRENEINYMAILLEVPWNIFRHLMFIMHLSQLLLSHFSNTWLPNFKGVNSKACS